MDVIENDETVFIERMIQLTDLDLNKIGQELVAMDTIEQELIDKKKTVTAELNSKIQENKSNMKESIRLLRNKERREEVLCRWDYDYKGGEVYFVSVESGEIISRRPMNDEERQLQLFAMGKKKDDGAAGENAGENAREVQGDEPEYVAPMCHMRPMPVKDEDEFGITYQCLKCKSKKTITKSTGM